MKTNAPKAPEHQPTDLLKVPPWIFSIVFTAWAGFFLTFYLKEKKFFEISYFTLFNRITDWSRHPGDLSLTAWAAWMGQYLFFFLLLVLFLLGCKGTGRIFTRFFLPYAEENWLNFWVEPALGMAFFSFLLYGLGLTGLLYAPLAYVLLILMAGLFAWQQKSREITLIFPVLQSTTSYPLKSWFKWGALLLLLLTALSNLLGAMAPERFYDSLVYHLTVPHIFNSHHKIFHIENNFLSSYPMGLHMIFGLGDLLGSHFFGKYLCWLMGIVCAVMIFQFAEKYISAGSGLLAAVIFYTIPIVQVNAWSTVADMGMTLFVLAGIFLYWQSRESEHQDKGALYLSALFLGIAFTVKYNSIYCSFPVFLLFLFERIIRRKSGLLRLLKEALILSTLFVLPIAVYFAKNYAFTANPFFPYAGHLWGTWGIDATRIDHLIAEQREYWAHGVWEYVKLPWALTIKGETGDSFIGPLILLFAPLVLFIKSTPVLSRVIYPVFILSLGIWMTQTHIPRFFMPGLFLACLIATRGAMVVVRESKILRIPCLMLILLLGAFNFVYSVTILWENIDPWGVVTGRQSKTHYLATKLQRSSYPAMEYANKNFKSESKILLIGDSRGYYLERPFIACTAYDHSPLWLAVSQSKNIEELRIKIKQYNITHLLHNEVETMRLQRQYYIFRFEKEHYPLLREFWEHHLEKVYSQPNLALYAVRFDKPVKGDPLPASLLPSARAQQFFMDKKYDEALREFQKAFDVGDVHSVHYYFLSAIYMKLDRVEDALMAARKSIELDPQNTDAYNYLGTIYLTQGNAKEAARYLVKSLAINPSQEKIRNMLRELQ